MKIFKRRYVYQYCASCERSDGETTFLDGVVWLKDKPLFMKDYRSIKKVLLEGLELDNIVIRTLSYVGREPFFNLQGIDD
jgi:hypothetical protein